MSLAAFFQVFAKAVSALCSQKAHAEVTLTLRDGNVTLVRINRTYSPENMPNV